MKRMRTLGFLTAIAASAQLHAKQPPLIVECVFEAPMGTSLRDGEFSSRPVTFKDMDTPWIYRFTIDPVEPGRNTKVFIESDEDFATISGSYTAIAVAPHSYALTAIKVGNCMFSSQLCGAFIQLTDLTSEAAAAAMNPISYFGGQDGAQFFHVDIVGKCTKIHPAEKE